MRVVPGPLGTQTPCCVQLCMVVQQCNNMNDDLYIGLQFLLHAGVLSLAMSARVS